MESRKWITITKGILLSATITLLFFGFAKILVGPVAGGNAERYRQEQGLQPPVGEWFVENANMYADGIPGDWLIIFGLFWLIVALFGKGDHLLPKNSLAILAFALSLNFYRTINVIFDWFYWSCFEAPHTHEGFSFQLLLECPSRTFLDNSIVWAPVVLAITAGFVAVFHSRKQNRKS